MATSDQSMSAQSGAEMERSGQKTGERSVERGPRSVMEQREGVTEIGLSVERKIALSRSAHMLCLTV